MEHEKRPRSVSIVEDDSPSEAQLQGPKDDQSESEADRSRSEYDPLESHDDSGSDEKHIDKDGSRGRGSGSRNGGVNSSGDRSGSSVGISGWNGSESSVTCGRSGLSMSSGWSASGSGSGSEADLSGSEYGPLESDDEDRLSARELVCAMNQADENAEAKIREILLAALPRKATISKRHSTAGRGRSGTRSRFRPAKDLREQLERGRERDRDREQEQQE